MDSSIGPTTSTVAAQAGKDGITPESSSYFQLTKTEEDTAPKTASTLIAAPRVLQAPQTYESPNVHIYNDDGIYLGGKHIFYDMILERMTPFSSCHLLTS